MTDILRIGNQTVHFASSEDMTGFIQPASVDFIMTSPPYWDLKDYGHPDQIGASSYEEYLDRLTAVWSECYRVAKSDAVMVINVGNRRRAKQFYPIGLDIANRVEDWTLWDILIWYIPNALPQPHHYMERLFDNKFEFLLVFTKGDPDTYTFHKPRVPQKYIDADPRDHKKNERGRCIGNVIRVPAYKPPNVKDLGYHAAAYPEELVALMLGSFTDTGDTVLDPFLGSGTTLKVARVMGRAGVGIELNIGYRDLIEKRIHEHWEIPDWRKLDILHSSTMEPGMSAPRKIQYRRQSNSLRLLEEPATYS